MCRSNAVRQWEYRAAFPIGEPAALDQLSSGRKRFRHRPAHFPESEHLLWLRSRVGNAPANRLFAIAPPDAPPEKPIHVWGIWAVPSEFTCTNFVISGM